MSEDVSMRESSERAMEGSARGDGGQPVDPAANGVSKHPVASIPTTDLSFADIERSRSHPVRWACYIIAVLAAIIAPYWLGRMIAVEHTAWLVGHLSAFEPRGVALVSWAVTVLALAGLGMIIVESHNWLGRIIFFLGLVAEQFIAGLCLLRFDFWYATYVVYGDDAAVPNAANLGIIAAGVAVAVYAVLFVGLLVMIRKDSPLNVLTRSWASFILFFAIEAIALLVVLFGGLLTAV
ncbi:the export of O-antigen and teichoic acid related membrane protein [Bifidobacterium pullorum]|uniref:The export of O-antigen and teichoic acid related membrane protein n=2 Tax=Bifidobacterium pullorum TaxID=78448 RepID=A0A7V8HPN1_9BIFI|nr:the export of O-antigen and teichoic acid related membrane protein [Bifidobacterium pullorum]